MNGRYPGGMIGNVPLFNAANREYVTEGQCNAQRRRAGKRAAANPTVREKFGIPKGQRLKDKPDAVVKMEVTEEARFWK